MAKSYGSESTTPTVKPIISPNVITSGEIGVEFNSRQVDSVEECGNKKKGKSKFLGSSKL